MLKANGGYHGEVGEDEVGGIEATAEAGFEDYGVDVGVGEVLEGQGGGYFEEGCRDVLRLAGVEDFCQDRVDFRLRDAGAINLHALAEGGYVGGDEEAGFVAGEAEGFGNFVRDGACASERAI